MREPPAPLSEVADRALLELSRASGSARLEGVTGHTLLTERARLLGLSFGHAQAPGEACRLLPAADGVMAVNLPRDEDWELVPAWLETTAPRVGDWDPVAEAVRTGSAARLLDRARLLGLPMAIATPPDDVAPPFFRLHEQPPASARPPAAGARPRVVDLSALWAGPLCAHLLHLCGADVVKVESTRRPDGARAGHAGFYGLLNQGKRCVALDFREPSGRDALARLITSADIVVDASRPRALRQLGIDAEAIARRHGLTWVSITGYGRGQPEGDWVAFGDDAAVAAGLADAMRDATGDFEFAGDAIADPLTGIHGALAAWQAWQAGGHRLVALSLRDVSAACLAQTRSLLGRQRLRRALAEWWGYVDGRQLDTAEPGRPVREPVAALGQHTRMVLAELETRC